MDVNFSELVKSKSDTELEDIYLHKEAYQAELYQEAIKEINVRGIDMQSLNEKLEEIKQERLAILQEKKDGNVLYMIICLVLSLLGGLIGIIGGYIYAFSKVKTEEGTFYTYNETTRNWGKVIFFVGITVFTIAIISKLNG